MNTTLDALLTKLDESQHKLAQLDLYYDGQQPLSFLAPEARDALGNRFARMSSYIPRLAVTSLAERLRVTSFTRNGRPDPGLLWSTWLRNDLDQMAPVAHREALTLGRVFVMVWADDQGRAQATVESARQVAVLRDPATRQILSAVKRWDDADGTRRAVLLESDTITHFTNRADSPAGWTATDTIPNPLGQVPLVALVNSDRLLDTDGRSEITDLMCLVDALNKSLADLMVSSEYFARPRRYATGVELVERAILDNDGNDTGQTETINPLPENDKMMISESPEAKFGQLAAADLSAHESSVRVLTSQLMAVSGLPAHFLGVLNDTPASADALRAAEASLAARAAARQLTFGRAWEQVGRLMVAVETGADPLSLDVGVTWADPATRSIAQEADALVKLFTAGLLPARYALERLGYTAAEIDTITTTPAPVTVVTASQNGVAA